MSTKKLTPHLITTVTYLGGGQTFTVGGWFKWFKWTFYIINTPSEIASITIHKVWK